MASLDSISDDILLAMKNKGLSYKEMGSLLGISSATICREFKKRSLDINERKLQNISNSLLIRYRESNKSYEEIAKDLNVSINTVISEYKLRGIEIEIDKSKDRLLADIKDHELIQLRLDGLSYDEIAEKYNVSKSLIIKEFKNRKIKDNLINRKCKIVSLDSSILEELKLEYVTYEKVAEALDVSTVAVHKEYKNRGLKDSH